MSYKILRITNLYKEYIESFYSENSNYLKQTYQDQNNELTNDSIELVSSYCKFFSQIGIDAIVVITNASHLQKAWALENNVSFELPFEEFILLQIKHFKPEILWIDDTRLMNKSWLTLLKSTIPSIRLLVGHICAPYNGVIEESLSCFDIMFTCTPGLKNEFIKKGLESHCIYHSFDHTLLDIIPEINYQLKSYDFVFTGSLYLGPGLHKNRLEFLEELIAKNISIQIFGNLESRKRILQKQLTYFVINFINSIGLKGIISSSSVLKKIASYGDSKITYYSNELLKSVQPPVFGIEMLRILSNSKKCFNIHGEVANNCAGNIRLFEATGVGSCLITDWKSNISNLFVPDEEVITYRSVEECIEKVQWLNENPIEAEKISKAGQKRTLKDHTVLNRVNEVHAIFLKALQKN